MRFFVLYDPNVPIVARTAKGELARVLITEGMELIQTPDRIIHSIAGGWFVKMPPIDNVTYLCLVTTDKQLWTKTHSPKPIWQAIQKEADDLLYHTPCGKLNKLEIFNNYDTNANRPREWGIVYDKVCDIDPDTL